MLSLLLLSQTTFAIDSISLELSVQTNVVSLNITNPLGQLLVLY